MSGKRIFDAWKDGVSVISLHTRLDAGEGGVNDALAEKLGYHYSHEYTAYEVMFSWKESQNI